MIGLNQLYWLTGAVFAAFALAETITIKSIVTRIVEPVSTMQVQTRILQSMQTRISP